ncbi:uncharacterized protein LOC143023505 [Oratosquilla oratoria]|uniref:uncharacterized protein LOC143023505 n=1 Tax=Oratosquilla oratoria TaxID=337810 RepID=UPI003F766F9E
MAPPHTINTLSRSLVRIPGNGSDVSARPLCLNLARTLTNTDGPLGSLVQQCLAQSQESFRPIAPFGSSESREARPPSAAVKEASKNNPRGGTQVEKRPVEDKGEAERKRSCPANSQDAPVVREYLDVRVSSSSGNASSDSQSSAVSDQPSGDNPACAGCSRPVLRPVSVISQLVETVQELQKKQEECEKEKTQLKDEIELLNKKLATFREIFQDTGKLRAVLKRLNIKL